MTSVRTFHRYRGETSFSLQRLVAILKEQIPEVAPLQTRYRVTEIPTERTIRFYTTRGLVDKPAAHTCGKALYGYRHLLQILAVKYLQSQYLPLIKVRSLIQDADNRELEQMIPAIAPVTSTHRGITRQDRTVTGARISPPETTGAITPPATTASGSPLVEETPRLDTWHRVEIGPGIELHVLDAALTVEQRERLRRALLREIGVLRGWFGDGEKT